MLNFYFCTFFEYFTNYATAVMAFTSTYGRDVDNIIYFKIRRKGSDATKQTCCFPDLFLFLCAVAVVLKNYAVRFSTNSCDSSNAELFITGYEALNTVFYLSLRKTDCPI